MSIDEETFREAFADSASIATPLLALPIGKALRPGGKPVARCYLTGAIACFTEEGELAGFWPSKDASEPEPEDPNSFEVTLGTIGLVEGGGRVCAGLSESLKTTLRDRAAQGLLLCEYGLPHQRDGESLAAYMTRFETITLDNVCASIIDIRFKNSPSLQAPSGNLISIIGRIKPFGPRADAMMLHLKHLPAGAQMQFHCRGRKRVLPSGIEGLGLYDFQDITTWDIDLSGEAP